jgi:hypothetical protein
MQIEYYRRVAEVDYGYFLPQIEKHSFVFDLHIFSLFVTKDFLKLYFDFKPEFRDSFLTMRFSLSRTDVLDKIVFEKFASPLAQFLSILNTLMSLGIIAMLISEARVFE